MSELSPPPLRLSNRPLALLGRLILWGLGWRISGQIPTQKKLVLIVAPHTSTWDFPVAIACKWALNVDARWLGKAELFKGWKGRFMRWAGGIPVDRDKTRNLVNDVVDVFEQSDELWLGISPEGTRKHTERWKTGFYHLARGAGVPLWCAALDAGTRSLDLGIVIELTGDESVDMAKIREYYSTKSAIHPDRFGPIRLRVEDSAPEPEPS